MNDFSKSVHNSLEETNFANVKGIAAFILAFVIIGQALAQDGDLTPLQYFRKAETYIQNHQWEEALAALDACIVRDPRQTEAFNLRATVREHFGMDEEALTDYNIYLELRPENTEALFARGQLQFRLGKYEAAKSDFMNLTYLPHTETNTVFFQTDAYAGGTSKVFTTQGVQKAYLFNYIGLAEVELANLKSAIQWYDSALLTLQNDADIFANRGIAKEKNKDPQGALLDFTRALQLNPAHAIAKQHLAALSKDIDPASASALLDAAIIDNPNLPDAYAERGFDRMQKGMNSEALADYNQAIRLNPRNEEYFLNRGLIKERLKDLDGAYQDYTKAIDLRSDFDKAWLNRGNLLARIGKLMEAVEDYSVAITFNPAYSAAYYNRAIARGRLRQDQPACEDLNTAEKLGHAVPAKVKRQICR